MSTAQRAEVYTYECAGCGSKAIAKSPWADDMPEGVYLTIRRVTEAQNHYLTEELYCCSKECAIDLVQYGIHHNAVAFEPIQRKRSRYRRKL